MNQRHSVLCNQYKLKSSNIAETRLSRIGSEQRIALIQDDELKSRNSEMVDVTQDMRLLIMKREMCAFVLKCKT